jgi:hypothetical protein
MAGSIVSAHLTVRELPLEDCWKNTARVPKAHRKNSDGRHLARGRVCHVKMNGRDALLALRGCKTDEAIIQIDLNARNKLKVVLNQSYRWSSDQRAFGPRYGGLGRLMIRCTAFPLRSA